MIRSHVVYPVSLQGLKNIILLLAITEKISFSNVVFLQHKYL